MISNVYFRNKTNNNETLFILLHFTVISVWAFSSEFLTFFRIFALCSWQRGLILIDLSGNPAGRKLAIFRYIDSATYSTIRYRGTGRDNRMIDYMDPLGHDIQF